MDTITKSAIISDNDYYRYELRRVWDERLGLVNFIGLNPSTADAEKDDNTIRRCIRFARDWGFGGLIMTNLFAFRLTDSARLRHVKHPIGPENDRYMRAAAVEARQVVAAWSTHRMTRVRVIQIVRNGIFDGIDLCAIRLTEAGEPEHPLYLPKDLKPIPFHLPSLSKEASHHER